jgi:hypothetical protein
MAEADHEEVICTFSGVTGADYATAQHVLEAHSWDLNNSVNFFLEQQAGAALPPPRAPQEHPVPSLEEDEDEDLNGCPAPSRPVPPTAIEIPDSPVPGRPPAAGQRSGAVWNEHGADDEELRQALAASARETGECWVTITFKPAPTCVVLC